jgi:uncharacterized membrane protein YkvA (DUF1232 family)
MLKREAYALYFVSRDPRTPWHAKALVGLVLAYLASPIDLIPDFIPVLGYLDDLVIAPAGIALALRMIPAEVMAEARTRAEEQMSGQKPVSRVGAALIVATWLAVSALAVWWIAEVVMG